MCWLSSSIWKCRWLSVAVRRPRILRLPFHMCGMSFKALTDSISANQCVRFVFPEQWMWDLRMALLALQTQNIIMYVIKRNEDGQNFPISHAKSSHPSSLHPCPPFLHWAPPMTHPHCGVQQLSRMTPTAGSRPECGWMKWLGQIFCYLR